MSLVTTHNNTQESEIGPAPPIASKCLREFHRTKKVQVSNPLNQAKIDLYQVHYLVDKALRIEEKYRERKSKKSTIFSFFCCAINCKRNPDLDFISYVANGMKAQLTLAGMLLAVDPTKYENVQATAKNAESIIRGTYIYLLRKISHCHISVLRRNSDTSESILYGIVSENLNERDGDYNDLDCLVGLSVYLENSRPTNSRDCLLVEAWLKKIQAQINSLSRPNSDAEMEYGDDAPLIHF